MQNSTENQKRQKMKRLFILIIMVLIFQGCATVQHKDITTVYKGFGVDLYYQSRVAIPADQIPLFIDAVNRLEKLLQERNYEMVE